MIVKRAGSKPSTMQVTFVLPATIWAETIHIVGDFNGWNRHTHPLVLSEDNWQATIELQRSKHYHFHYLADDTHWFNDWNADGYAANPLTGHNSTLEI